MGGVTQMPIQCEVTINDCRLILGNCLEVLPLLLSRVDAVITDPPYGTTQNKWDSVLPLDALWSEYWRVAKPNAAIVLFAAQPFTSLLVCSQIAFFRYDWTWRKPKGTGHLNAKKQPMRDKEDILIFCAVSPPYNPQFSEGTAYKAKPGKSKVRGEDCYGSYADKREDNEGRRYPKQVLDFPIVERDKLHPTQKPVDLMEYLIRTYTNKGDTVLDNTMGSGTTGVACVNLGRKFIGIEIDKGYFDTACERIRNAYDLLL